MFRLPVSDFRGPPLYPHLYPGQRPPGDFVLSFYAGVPTVFSLAGSTLANVDEAVVNDGHGTRLGEFLARRGRARAADRYPTLAYGSNVCPMQLVERKFGVLASSTGLPNIDVVVLRGTTAGFAAGYLAHVAPYGSIPATLLPGPGTVETYCVLLDGEQLLRMHETEEVRSGLYSCAPMPFATDGARLGSCYGYVSGSGGAALVQAGQPISCAGPEYAASDDFVPIAASACPYPQQTQPEVMRYCADLVRAELRHDLYDPAGPFGKLSDWAIAQLPTINAHLREKHSQRFPSGAETVVDQPWDLASFKTLRQVL